jgi:hypothetical protein
MNKLAYFIGLCHLTNTHVDCIKISISTQNIVLQIQKCHLFGSCWCSHWIWYVVVQCWWYSSRAKTKVQFTNSITSWNFCISMLDIMKRIHVTLNIPSNIISISLCVIFSFIFVMQYLYHILHLLAYRNSQWNNLQTCQPVMF